MQKLITFIVGTVLCIAVISVNYGCTKLQVENCENDGGQAITRYLGVEYSGCINE